MLKDKVILVTGASRGIGKASAILLAKNNAKVIINYCNSKDKALEVQNEIKQVGAESTIMCADVSKEEDVRNMFKQVKEKFGRLDVLVNNAGIMSSNLLLMATVKEFDDIISTNCKGVFLCSKYASKMMIGKGGKIINVSSIVGVNGNSGQAIYSGSKAFIIGFTKSLAKELGAFNISVNAIAPGLIDTDMTRELDEKIKKDILTKIALKRIGAPDDVARVVLFLCSELSNYVSGQVIGIDGSQVI